MSTVHRNCDHDASASAVNDCCRCSGTDHIQANSDGETFGINSCGNPDGIAGSSQGDGVADGFAGGCGRLAVVVVTASCAVDIPSGAGKGRWSQEEKQRHRESCP